MNLANKLTISRIILSFIFIIFLTVFDGLASRLLALLVFIAACLTDYYDGLIARRQNIITDFGKFMDPIADKILVLGAFLSFVQMQLVHSWMVVLILSREIIITSIRLFALKKGRVLAAERAGKHKTVSQMVAIFLILIYLIFKEIMIRFFSWNSGLEVSFSVAIFILMSITVVLTLISGISYLWRNRKIIS
jgi:CDP-diacylglycerol--glycerol-3-phosphate 3-phosphatidyltransferase